MRRKPRRSFVVIMPNGKEETHDIKKLLKPIKNARRGRQKG